ncbi:tRNA lysidine(34) synthetase TilS [Costertonia aggregata]|uniref:tRNA lysidine(34) synthetase TilS n=1 Tax=Costertonia aggregata TaxID=343403 RepID=UPI001D1545CE|nr:tRNA lysidine(34) synthetase TilS [Costertonia aggregata]
MGKTTFLLACSGGVDSVVLAHLCYVCEMDFSLAHCNFRLRGDESESDETFVENLAKEFRTKFYVTHFDTIGYVNKNKLSIQVAARELRYAWFAEIMQENRISTLVTAHQADDNLETFLINLSRGTGVDGLTGIPEKTDTIARPLLPFSRKRILEYAKTKKLSWREDSSNVETKYLRNKIRHELLPELKELHPTFLNNFQNTLGHLSDSSKILENHIYQLKSELFLSDNGSIRIKISDIKQLKPQKAYVYQLFKSYGFTAWEDILNLLNGLSGKKILSKTHQLVKNREYLILEELGTETDETYTIEALQTEMMTPVRLKIESVRALGETGKHILYADADTLAYPLTVRKWKKGDYIYPYGMKGKKKVSKFFKDEKIDIISKRKQWLLCSGNAIVWIVGKRSDNRFKITKTTKKIIKFTLHT